MADHNLSIPVLSDSKLTDSSVFLQKLLPLYSVRKPIAILRMLATLMDFLVWVNDDEGLTGKC